MTRGKLSKLIIYMFLDKPNNLHTAPFYLYNNILYVFTILVKYKYGIKPVNL